MTGWVAPPPSGGPTTSPSNDTAGGIGRFGVKGLGDALVRSLMEDRDKMQLDRVCAIATWHLDMLLAIEVLQSKSLTLKGTSN